MSRSTAGALRLLLLAVAAEPVAGAAGDARVAWLREHAIPLATLDPAEPELDDLLPLRDVLEGVRVVLLGEAARGDGSAFLGPAGSLTMPLLSEGRAERTRRSEALAGAGQSSHRVLRSELRLM